MEAFSRAVYPENYILFGSPYALEKDIDAIISNAKTRRPESFEGNKDSFVFEFRYIEPFDKNFKELKRLQGTAAEAAGRRYEFKGYIVIDLSAYLNHHEEDYMEKILFFLIDMSGFWKYIFLVDDQNPKAARELAGKVLMHFTLDNLPCRVIETKEKISAIEYINMTCKERNIRCSSSVKEFFQDLLKQNFSKEMVSALIMDISWQHGKLINEDILETALSNQNSLIYYMLTPKEFSRFRTFVEHRKEKWNGEKKEI